MRLCNLRRTWLWMWYAANVNAYCPSYTKKKGKWKSILICYLSQWNSNKTILAHNCFISFLSDLSLDPDELTNIATEFPEITYSLDQKLRSIVNYPKVSASVHQYNKEQFIMWKQSVGQNYSNVIAHLRWHQDWQRDPRKYENAIQHWLTAHSSPLASSPTQSTSGSQPTPVTSDS